MIVINFQKWAKYWVVIFFFSNFSKQTPDLQNCAKLLHVPGLDVFFQACWFNYRQQYPNEISLNEIEELNRQFLDNWSNLTEEERERFKEMEEELPKPVLEEDKNE